MEEIRSHTSLRGIAALLVVIVHFRSGLQGAIDLDQYTHFFAKGYLWVDFFFILSGFILCHVYATKPGNSILSATEFLWARFARIYPLHIATLLFLVCLQLLESAVYNKTVQYGEWSTFWMNIFNIHGWGLLDKYDWNFPSWSISAEIAAYLSFPIICIGLLKAPRATFTFMSIAIALRVIYLIAADDPRAGWERLVLTTSFPMFFVGVILYQFRETAKRMNERTMTTLQVFAIVLITLLLHKGGNDALIIAPFALLVFATQTDTGILSKLLTEKSLIALGLWSYSIYLLHIPVKRVMDNVWPKFVTSPLELTVEQSAAGGFIVLIITTIGAGAVSYIFFETPARRVLRKFILTKK